MLCAHAPITRSAFDWMIYSAASAQCQSHCRWSWKTRVTLLLALLTSTTVFAQGQFTRIYGPDDQDVPIPQFTQPTGSKDPVALQTILAYLNAVNATTWTGIQATGTFALTGNAKESQDAATLTISGGNNFRLDLTTPSGGRSIRVYGKYGAIQEANGSKHSLPFLAAQAGIFAFPKLLGATFSADSAAVIDGGSVSISGKGLRRITIEEPLNPSSAKLTSENTSVMDLYFDVTSHLLVKSAVAVPMSWSDRGRYLQVTTYSDYQLADGVLIPFTYSQTIDGQPTWTLQLSSVQPLPSVKNSYFHF